MAKVNATTVAPEFEVRTVEIPLGEGALTTWCLHIDTELSAESAHKLRRLADALDRKRETYKGRKGAERITNATQALKWLLEKI